MNIIWVVQDIFLERINNKAPLSIPYDLTEHYKKERWYIYLDAIYIATKYSEIEKSLTRYKYSSERENVDLYVDLILKIGDLYPEIFDKNPTFVPVPMHWSRYIFRGFDHTFLIVAKLSKILHLPYQKLLSTRWTRHQSKLAREKRLENKKNTFRIRNHKNIPEFVVLFDDVISSGSTADECARILKDAGVKRVVGIFLASNL